MSYATIVCRAAGLPILARGTALLLPSAPSRSYATPASHQGEIDEQLNGYPQLPFVSRQYLPPTGWWDQQMRRNFGDTVHEEDEVLSMWGPDIPVVPPRTALFQFTLATLAFVGFGLFAKAALIPDRPAVAREYPFSGLISELGGMEENQANPEDESDD